MSAQAEGVVKLAPSDFGFLFDECQRCFWLKAKGVLRRPSAPFPKVFGKLDLATKDFYLSKRTDEMSVLLRPGRVIMGDRTVRSAPLRIPGHRTEVILQGRIDTALAFDDGTHGVIDFKTSEPKPEHVLFYGRQLHAYATALEHPGPGAIELPSISTLGLICIEPQAMVALGDGVAYAGTSTFLEIPRDDDAFTAFLLQVLLVLEQPEPPAAAPRCSFCQYGTQAGLMSLTGMYGSGLT